MPTKDQVVWGQIGINHAGENQYFKKGELLPDPADGEETSTRTLLRIGGALRVVEVVYTPDELAAQAKAAAETAAAREAPQAPAAAEAAAPVARPTLTPPAAAPVVIGDEDLRAEHERDAKAAAARRQPSGVKPPAKP